LGIRGGHEVEADAQAGELVRHYNQYRMGVIVTGASGGLGQVVVEAFLAEGASVYGVDLAWKQAPANSNFHALEANVLEASDCERVVASAEPVDALVHLVGGFAGGKPVAETADDVWTRMLDLNLRAAINMFRAVLPGMVQASRGRIMAVGSRAAAEPMANFAAYSVSKAALVTLVKTVALEVKGTGITANVILPSVIDTGANRAAMPKADVSKWVKPESIAGLLVWLASEEARDVSGAAVPIYGGA